MSFVPRSKSDYKRSLPITLNTSSLVKLLVALQLLAYVFVLLVGLIHGNQHYHLTSQISSSLTSQEDAFTPNDNHHRKRDTLGHAVTNEGHVIPLPTTSASGKLQAVFSLFEIINHNYPYKSLFFICTALVSALRSYAVVLFNVLLWKFFRQARYARLNVYSTSLGAVTVLKYANWLVFNYITVEDSQNVQVKSFLTFLILSNVGYYLAIFKVLKKNIVLFETLIKSSNFSSGALTFNKVFNQTPKVFVKSFFRANKTVFYKYLQVNYAVYTTLQVYLLRSFYYHQIANDLSYLNIYNFFTWVILLHDLYLDSLVLNLFGIGNSNRFWNVLSRYPMKTGKRSANYGIDENSKNNQQEETLRLIVSDNDQSYIIS